MLLLANDVGSRDLEGPLRKLGLPVELTYLPSADLAFVGRGDGDVPWDIGIEYKKLPEFIESLRTERLQGHQLGKMRKAYDVSYLVIEGELLYEGDGRLARRCGPRTLRPLHGGMAVGEFLKRLHVLCICGGLLPVLADTQRTALRHVESIYRVWTDKPRDQHTSHIAIYQAPALVPISEFRRFICGIEGVGVKTSLAIERHFGGSLRRAVLSDAAEWERIDGIGPKMAAHIVAVLKGEKAK